jgi:hypothetical protein
MINFYYWGYGYYFYKFDIGVTILFLIVCTILYPIASYQFEKHQ